MVCLATLLLLPVYLCMNVGPRGVLAAAWSAPFHSPPLLFCCTSSLPWLPMSSPPTGLDECFFFISSVVGLPYSSIFCQFWLFFIFKLLLSFFWLCEEEQCVYLCLHFGQPSLFFKIGSQYLSHSLLFWVFHDADVVEFHVVPNVS